MPLCGDVSVSSDASGFGPLNDEHDDLTLCFQSLVVALPPATLLLLLSCAQMLRLHIVASITLSLSHLSSPAPLIRSWIRELSMALLCCIPLVSLILGGVEVFPSLVPHRILVLCISALAWVRLGFVVV